MPLIGNQIRRKAVDRERGLVGGEGGIRTSVTRKGKLDFESLLRYHHSLNLPTKPSHFRTQRLA